MPKLHRLNLTEKTLMVTFVLASVCCSLVLPTHAQIAPIHDEHGKIVYMNADSRPSRSGGAISLADSSNASSPALSGASFGAAANSMSNSSARSISNSGSDSALGDSVGNSRVSLAGANRASDSQPSKPEGRLDRIVREAAVRHQLDPALVKAVITTESNWNPRAISNKGAVGLMQLIPGTAQRFGVRNSLDPAQNVEGGATYLKSLLDRYNGDLTKSLAAYNAGEHAVDLNNGVPAYLETVNYVRKVTDAYFQPGSGRNPTLWSAPRPVVRREASSSGGVVFTNE